MTRPGDYIVPNVLSPKHLVFKPDYMDGNWNIIISNKGIKEVLLIIDKSFIDTSKGPAQVRVSMDIFHDGLRRKTCITLAQYPIILAVHSVHFANFLRTIYAAEWF